MTKREVQYFDINATEYSEHVRALIVAQKRTYEADRDAKRSLLAQLRKEINLGADYDITGVFYTRWGQLQISVGKMVDKAVVTASKRPTLSQFLANAKTNGQSY